MLYGAEVKSEVKVKVRTSRGLAVRISRKYRYSSNATASLDIVTGIATQDKATMASTAKQICRQARHVSSPRTQCLLLRQSQRPFSHTSLRMAESSTNDDSAPYFNKAFFNRLDAADQAAYRGFTTSERRDMERVDEAIRDELGPDSHANREMRDAIRYAVGDIEEEFPEPPQERERRSQDFFNEGEKEYLGPDRPFQEDDISSMGHADLEQKREIREYARNAAWEMPLLSSMSTLLLFHIPTTLY